MKITISISIFNAGVYLRDTLESVLNQEYKNLEVLLVDDGSTDNSPEICFKFCQYDTRFKYIRQNNRGLSAARNTGIYHAGGDYIWFLDADDMIEENALVNIVQYLSDIPMSPDILFSNSLLFTEKGPIKKNKYKYDINFLREANFDQVFCYLFESFGNVWSVWCHLFKMEYIKNNNLLFDINLKRGEDLDWMIKSILAAKYFDAFPDYIHRYRCDAENSIHKQRAYDLFKSGYDVSVKWFRYFQHIYNGQARDYMLRYLAEYYVHFGSYINTMPTAQKREAMRLYRINIDIAKYRSESMKRIKLLNFN